MSSPKVEELVRRRALLTHGAGALCSLAAAAAVWALVYAPLKSGNEQARQQLRESLGLIHDSLSIRKTFEETRAQYDRTTEELSALRKKIPATSAESEFLTEAARMAGEVGLEVNEFFPGQVTETDLCRQMEVRLRTRGEYSSTCRFLTGLNELSRLSRIKSAKISADNSADGMYVMDLTLAIYFGLPDVVKGPPQQG